jgi:ribonuclease PH
MCPRGSSRRAIPVGCFVIYAEGDTLFCGGAGAAVSVASSWLREVFASLLSVCAGAVLLCPLLVVSICVAVVLSMPVFAAYPDVVVASPKPRSGW